MITEPGEIGRRLGRRFRELVEAGERSRPFAARVLDGHRRWSERDVDPWCRDYSAAFLAGYGETDAAPAKVIGPGARICGVCGLQDADHDGRELHRFTEGRRGE